MLVRKERENDSSCSLVQDGLVVSRGELHTVQAKRIAMVVLLHGIMSSTEDARGTQSSSSTDKRRQYGDSDATRGGGLVVLDDSVKVQDTNETIPSLV